MGKSWGRERCRSLVRKRCLWTPPFVYQDNVMEKSKPIFEAPADRELALPGGSSHSLGASYRDPLVLQALGLAPPAASRNVL